MRTTPMRSVVRAPQLIAFIRARECGSEYRDSVDRKPPVGSRRARLSPIPIEDPRAQSEHWTMAPDGLSPSLCIGPAA